MGQRAQHQGPASSQGHKKTSHTEQTTQRVCFSAGFTDSSNSHHPKGLLKIYFIAELSLFLNSGLHLPIFSKGCLVLWLILCSSLKMFCKKVFAMWQKNKVPIKISTPQYFLHRIWFLDKKSAILSFPSSMNLLHYLVNLIFHSMLNLVKLCVIQFNSSLNFCPCSS